MDLNVIERLADGDASAALTVRAWARATIASESPGIAREDLDDLVQQTIADVLAAARRPGFEVLASPQAFVKTVARRRLTDSRRRIQATMPFDDERFVPPAPRPSFALRRTLKAVLRLGELCRMVFYLYFYEERSHREIAERLNRREATSRQRLFLCLQQVRRILASS
jgi:RNA polymerase sigma factor (sigma-70 family)